MSVEAAVFNNLSKEMVLDYLKAHPDFLEHNPEILQVLTPPQYHSGERVIDMQRFMMERLKQQIEMLQKEFGNLIFSCRDNMTAQNQVHQAVVELLECEDLDRLMHLLSEDVQRLFAVDVVKLCVEADVAPFQDAEYAALQFMPAGTITRLLGREQALLGNTPLNVEQIFGSATQLVASYALVKLNFRGYPHPGLIAFGVRNKDQFHGGQGTDLLRFLGRIIEFCILRVWHNERDGK